MVWNFLFGAYCGQRELDDEQGSEFRDVRPFDSVADYSYWRCLKRSTCACSVRAVLVICRSRSKLHEIDLSLCSLLAFYSLNSAYFGDG